MMIGYSLGTLEEIQLVTILWVLPFAPRTGAWIEIYRYTSATNDLCLRKGPKMGHCPKPQFLIETINRRW